MKATVFAVFLLVALVFVMAVPAAQENKFKYSSGKQITVRPNCDPPWAACRPGMLFLRKKVDMPYSCIIHLCTRMSMLTQPAQNTVHYLG